MTNKMKVFRVMSSNINVRVHINAGEPKRLQVNNIYCAIIEVEDANID